LFKNSKIFPLGICARRLAIPIIHSAVFHQARPIDYPKGHLQMWKGQHISFHKFEEIDPIEIYKEFLEEKCEGECGAKRIIEEF
jgi:UDP-glucose:O-linked fucose beta-1,3-glucosyltransferase